MKHISTRAQFLLESEKKVVLKRPDGSIEFEAWFENGQLHRLDGPARIWYRPDGSIEIEAWYQNGKYHRLDGPAWIAYNRDGSIDRERTEWWQEGKKVAPDPTWFARQELKELGFSDEDADLIAPFF